MAKAAATKHFYATGRRKTSSARVFLKPGSGKVTVNGHTPEKYLSKATSRMVIMQPFQIVNSQGKFDLFVTVAGGGSARGGAGVETVGAARVEGSGHHPDARPARSAWPAHPVSLRRRPPGGLGRDYRRRLGPARRTRRAARRLPRPATRAPATDGIAMPDRPVAGRACAARAGRQPVEVTRPRTPLCHRPE